MKLKSMLIYILLGFGAVAAVLLIVVAMQPDDFRITRSAVIPAPPEKVFAQVNDFHNWNAWSPWAKLDPTAKNTFGGADAGEGATFAWVGNSQVGEGKMTLLKSQPNERINIQLEFFKPFQATNRAEFTFEPADGGTRVTWTMSGKNNLMGKAFSLIMNCDKMVGGQFEQGLENLKSVTR